MNNIKINTKVLMSGAEYFDDHDAINAYMDDSVPVSVERAAQEHADIENAFTQAGIEVLKVPAPEGAQDGVYTANWALCIDGKAIMSNLPDKRHDTESLYAERVLHGLGKNIIKLPRQYKFSGQGDALPCGKYLFVGSGYRTDKEVWPLLARETGLHVVGLQTVPQLDAEGNPTINSVTGWPDSFFYDIDLALAVISPTLIAWCPEAFTSESRARVQALTDIDTIEVDYDEATRASASNLVSTGVTVVMGHRAPKLCAALESRGLTVITPHVTELMKGGGFIRCTSLTL